jgi:hypothetical protein
MISSISININSWNVLKTLGKPLQNILHIPRTLHKNKYLFKQKLHPEINCTSTLHFYGKYFEFKSSVIK